MQPTSSWNFLQPTTLHLIFASCTSFRLMLQWNTNFVLFVLVLSLLLVLSIFPIYSRFTHPLGNSNCLQTSVYCAFHLSTLSHMVITLSLMHACVCACVRVCVCVFVCVLWAGYRWSDSIVVCVLCIVDVVYICKALWALDRKGAL